MCQPEFMYFNLDVVAKLWNNEIYLYICKTSNKINIESFSLEKLQYLFFLQNFGFFSCLEKRYSNFFQRKGYTYRYAPTRAHLLIFI
jgi:hypothetical protein